MRADILEIRNEDALLEVQPFDSDKELRVEIDQDEASRIYLKPERVNRLITYLAAQLKAIGEPCDLLDKVL